MALTAKPLAVGETTTTQNNNVYPARTAGTVTRITEIALTNTGTATEHISIWLRPNGAAASDANAFFKEYDVPHGVGFPFTFSMNTYLNYNDVISIQGEGTNITYRISGIEEA